MGRTISIPARFNGPPDSGNGGYSCGTVAAFLGNPAEVSLRAPPPLERSLTVEKEEGGVLVRDGDTVVAQGRPLESLDLDVPYPPSLEEAAAAGGRGHERWAGVHPFPTCVVCGPGRAPGDGFRVLAGPTAQEGLFASDWTPHTSLADGAGRVRDECVWAVLDCPSSSPVANQAGAPPIVLARLAAMIERPVRAQSPHLVISWPIATDGRKRHAGSALFSAEGERLALARALWIELQE